jgi:hypothetical protein
MFRCCIEVYQHAILLPGLSAQAMISPMQDLAIRLGNYLPAAKQVEHWPGRWTASRKSTKDGSLWQTAKKLTATKPRNSMP